MKKLQIKLLYRKKILGLFVIILLFSAGSVAYAFFPKSHTETASSTKTLSQKINQTKVTPTPSPVSEKVLGAKTYQSLPSPTVLVIATAVPTTHPITTQQNTSQQTTEQSQTTNTIAATSTPTPAAQPATSPTATPTQSVNTVSLQIQSPGGTTNATVTLKNGANVCDVLQEAKDEGKINSVTFDDSYMSSMHSKYVTEINGYKNNWTFSINGSSPLGCSLSNPKPNDAIVWKFG